MKVHINCYCTETPCTRLYSIHKDTKAFVEEINHLVSDGERQFLDSWINTKKIPTLQLSVKDHKPCNLNGRYPTWLIVWAHNFTQCLSKIASKSIEATFRCKAIQFEKHTPKNSPALKQQFEELNFKQERVTIVSLDIKDMYPQCRFKAVSNAVKHFATTLPDFKWERINKCLDILQFSTGNKIVTFQDKYYKYGVDADPNCHGLTIGRFELAFLTDLKASYIFDKLNYLLECHVHFIGTYPDNDLLVFRRRKTHEWLTQWLTMFQQGVDHLLRTQDIQFAIYYGNLEPRRNIKAATRDTYFSPRHRPLPPNHH